jgi:molecular chaperone DnaK
MTIAEQLADRIYGIDLGTTYSCIAYVDESSGVPVVITNSQDLQTTPSVAYFEKGGDVTVGQAAKNALAIHTERVKDFVKRDMGTEQCFNVDGKDHRPEEVSALILKKLVQDATKRLTEQTKLKHPIKRVVITVPAYFGLAERNATKAAGKMAGLEVVEILNEPTSASLSYRAGQPPAEERVLVYDLGGGTFDVSLMEFSGSIIKEVKIGGNSRLGGYDWDQALGALVIDKFIKIRPAKAHAQQDEMFLRRILPEVEKLKKQLSSEDVMQIPVTFDDTYANVEVTRSEFEELTSHLLEQTMETVREVVKEAKQSDSTKPSKVFLVGGSSKMPYVGARLKQVLKEELGVEVSVDLRDPDLSVAKGAAFRGFIKRLKEIAEANDGDFGHIVAAYPNLREYILGGKIYTNLTRSLGVRAVDANDATEKSFVVVHILHANDRLPATKTESFVTLVANQNAVNLPIFEQAGEHESGDPDHNVKVAEVQIDGLGAWNLPKGSPIQCTLRAEEDGTVVAFVKESTSGRSKEVKFSIVGGMTEPEVGIGKEKIEETNVSEK